MYFYDYLDRLDRIYRYGWYDGYHGYYPDPEYAWCRDYWEGFNDGEDDWYYGE